MTFNNILTFTINSVTMSTVKHCIELSKLIHKYFGQNIKIIQHTPNTHNVKLQNLSLEEKIKDLFGSNSCQKMIRNKSSS